VTQIASHGAISGGSLAFRAKFVNISIIRKCSLYMINCSYM
jgi:hypothetical protein